MCFPHLLNMKDSPLFYLAFDKKNIYLQHTFLSETTLFLCLRRFSPIPILRRKILCRTQKREHCPRFSKPAMLCSLFSEIHNGLPKATRRVQARFRLGSLAVSPALPALSGFSFLSPRQSTPKPAPRFESRLHNKDSSTLRQTFPAHC